MATNGPIDEFNVLFPAVCSLNEIESLFTCNIPGNNDWANACPPDLSGVLQDIPSLELFDKQSQHEPLSSPLKPIFVPTAESSDNYLPTVQSGDTHPKQTSVTTTSSTSHSLHKDKIQSLIENIEKKTAVLIKYKLKCDSDLLTPPSELSLQEQMTWVRKEKHKRTAQINRYNSVIEKLEEQLKIEQLLLENKALKKTVMTLSIPFNSLGISIEQFEFLQTQNVQLESTCKNLSEQNSEFAKTTSNLQTAYDNLNSNQHQLKLENDKLKARTQSQAQLLKAKEAATNEQLRLFMQQYQMLANAHRQLLTDYQYLSQCYSAKIASDEQAMKALEEYTKSQFSIYRKTSEKSKLYEQLAEKSERKLKERDAQLENLQKQIQSLTQALGSRNDPINEPQGPQAYSVETTCNPPIEYARKQEQATNRKPLSSYRTTQNNDDPQSPTQNKGNGNSP